MLVYFAKAETRFWGTVVIFIIIGIGYLGSKATRGYAIGYLTTNISDDGKKALLFIHGFASLIAALALPNNFLNKIGFFETLYEENELWIAVSVILLLFSFLVIIGTVFTLIAKKSGYSKK